MSFPLGAYHGAELQYLFGLGPSALDPDQRRLSSTMTGYWTQFARTGDPNWLGTPFWPGYRPDRERFQSLAPPTPGQATGFAAEHHCALWGG